jgi:hypothetical protein
MRRPKQLRTSRFCSPSRELDNTECEIAGTQNSCASTALPAAHDLAAELAILEPALSCVRALPLYDDVYHRASMRETTCVDSDGSITQIRVFDSPTATLVALQDWAIDPDSQWLVQNSNWFTIGARQHVEDVAAQAEVGLTPTQSIPLPPRATSQTRSTNALSS